jgi:hypothetical protein
MKLRKKDNSSIESKRQRVVPSSDNLKVSSTFAYSSSRSEENYNVGRQIDKAKPKVKKTANYWLQRFGLVILTIALIASLFKVLSVSSNPQILPVDSFSKAAITPQDESRYETTVSKIISSSVWNHNKITLDSNAIERSLIKNYPELSSVSVTIPLVAQRPIIYVQYTQPVIILTTLSNKSYALDNNGRAMYEASSPKALELPNIPTVNDQSGLNVQLNHQALPSTDISFVQTVVSQLANKGMSASNIILPSGTEELDVYIAGQPYYIKFNLADNDPRQQVGTYLATISQLQSENIKPSKYVDVRIDGRAYYL